MISTPTNMAPNRILNAPRQPATYRTKRSKSVSFKKGTSRHYTSITALNTSCQSENVSETTFIQQLKGCQPRRMEILREFLNSSTIHGLSHISNPKVRYDILVFNPLQHTDRRNGQVLLARNCCHWISWSWLPDCEFLP